MIKNLKQGNSANNRHGIVKKGTMLRLLKYVFSNYKGRMIVTCLCTIAGAMGSVITSVFVRRIVDDVVVPGLSVGLAGVYKELTGIIVSMAALYLISVFCVFIQTRFMAEITQGTLRNLRDDMFEKMEKLPVKYFDTHPHGDIMSTYTNDTDAIRELIGRCIPSFIQSFFSIIALFTMMLTFSVYMTASVILFLFLTLKVIRKIGTKSVTYMMAQQKSLAEEEGFIEEMMEGQRVIKVFCHQDESKKDFDAVNDKLKQDSTRANKFANILAPITNNMGNILYVFVALAGSLLVYFKVGNISLSGMSTISIGIVISFLGMVRALSQTIGQITQQINMITMGMAGASRVFSLMDEETEKDNGYVTLVCAKYDENGNITETDQRTDLWAWKHPHQADGSVTYTPLKGDIVMENVEFGYNEGTQVLFDISLYAKPGQKIAFVGATGAGKTTITNLLNRFYDIPDGKIRYDGININKIKKPDLRKSLGIVLQDVNLFSGTVFDNIRYGRTDATDEDCIRAAKLANAHSFITRLPEGYNTVLSANASNLSQGQRQLLSIARVAVADPPVMVLDEATSSIDTRTEAMVQEGMDNLMKGRTVFVIAHRLSTIRNSNAIMVLDHGRIIERGDHEDLINQKGLYYRLYTGAFELK